MIPRQLLRTSCALLAAALLPGMIPAAVSPDLAAADIVPGDAFAFLSIPDPKRAAAEWKNSVLFKIWQEPEVQAFFAKPLTNVPPIPAEVTAALGKFDAVGPKNAFVAVLSFEPQRPKVVGGFAFSGKPEDVAALLEKARAETQKSNPQSKPATVTHGSRTLDTLETKNGTIASCTTGNWYFIANDVESLKKTLDLIDTKGVGACLSKNPDFIASAAKMPARVETFWYLAAKPTVAMILKMAEQSGKKIPAAQKAELEKMQAIAAASAFDGGKLRDTLFVLAPGFTGAPGSLSFKSMPFTSADTLLYFTSMLKFPDETTGDKTDPIAAFIADFEKSGFKLAEIKAALVNEASLQADWTAGALYPSPILSIELKDRAAAIALVDRAIAKAGDSKDADWKSKTDEGVEYRTRTPKKQGDPIAPTVAITATHLLVGLSPLDVRTAITRAKGTSPRLDTLATYKTAFATSKPDQTLIYIDTKGLFEKVYGLARNFAPLLSDNPQAQAMVDVEKLPAVDAIAKHLLPMTLSTKRTPDGFLLESSGPLTIPQFLVGAAGTAAIAIPSFTKAASAAAPKPNAAPPAGGKEKATPTPPDAKKDKKDAPTAKSDDDDDDEMDGDDSKSDDDDE